MTDEEVVQAMIDGMRRDGATCDAAALESVLADALRWRMARADPLWLGFEHDVRPEQIDTIADAQLPQRAKNAARAAQGCAHGVPYGDGCPRCEAILASPPYA